MSLTSSGGGWLSPGDNGLRAPHRQSHMTYTTARFCRDKLQLISTADNTLAFDVALMEAHCFAIAQYQ